MKKKSESSYSWKQFFQLLISTRPSKAVIIGGFLASLVTTAAGLLIPLFTKNLIDGFSPSSLSWQLITTIVAVFVLQAVTNGFAIFLLNLMGQKMVASMREKLWKKTLNLPVSYFDNTKSGEMVSRMVNDTVVIKELIADSLPQFVTGVISVIGSIAILFVMDWKMTLLLIIAVPITALIIAPLGQKMFKISRGMQKETANFTGSISQTLSEVRLVKSSNAEAKEISDGTSGISRLLRFGVREAKVTAVIGPLMLFVVMGVIVGIIGYGGIRVSAGTLSTGTLIAFLLYLFQIIVPVTSFVTFFTQLQKSKGATERISEILEHEEENIYEGAKVDVSGKKITANNLFFSYNENEPILQDISFETSPGEVIAFAGPSGGGKSTLFALLERYYKTNSGEILVGNQPLNEISIHSWRSQIGYVSQESAMLSGTIRDNLCYGLDKEFSDDELWAVTKLAYADTFIAKLPNQLDTEVGERGVKLSGGQRQRIAIARAFLRDPKILMLDEATASLDSQSERIVQQALANLMEGRTTFVIAHRLSTIVNANQILFIEHGEITGRGTHSELVASHPLYATFAEQQLT
ncbi:putative ABC transporter ATP binding protein [Listeria grandensis FSL F6-0971]|uniref:Putative ABC transporter ATP binding protein n=1 Tax=Listeria grandensis FSL F6-0971 TaxID=1265819 RepID=W7B3Z4_9LIST|nr:ABC transporter ATP-binding protein [Listeria grandensis]EUJ20647.1 putative ABC transporter ATP binding protein [Listeria grandensis FSL F6-0971]